MNLLIASVLLLQDTTAEETFKKIEEQILKAKTVSVKFAWEARREGKEEHRVDGTLLVKEGNKFFLYEISTFDGKKMEQQRVSDGSRMAVWRDAERIDKPTPKNESTKLLNGLLHVGIVLKFSSKPKDPWGEPDEMNACDITTGGDEKDAKTLLYKFKGHEGMKGQVWYDPKTLRLIKRKISSGDTDKSIVWIETYDEFSLNAEIPDEKFKLIAEK